MKTILILTLALLSCNYENRNPFDGLEIVEEREYFRCGNCSKMKPDNSKGAWVPIFKWKKFDPKWVRKKALIKTSNHTTELWCFRCAMKYFSE
jgi:hypothetical protein